MRIKKIILVYYLCEVRKVCYYKKIFSNNYGKEDFHMIAGVKSFKVPLLDNTMPSKEDNDGTL